LLKKLLLRNIIYLPLATEENAIAADFSHEYQLVEKAIVLSWEPGDAGGAQTMPILL